MPFPWKKLFPDISSLRIRRSKKDHRMQSTSGDIEGDTSAPPADSNTLGIQSTLRTTSDVAQTVLPGVAAVAGVIPVAGSPLQAAIGGLLLVLQGIDRSRQNKQAIDGLKLLLEQLRSCLDCAPNTTDPRELDRRKFLTGVLENTKFELANNMNRPGFAYTARATQAIAGCSSNINTYLNLYSASSQMQVQDGVGAILAILQSNQSPGTFTMQCVMLVDATGDPHPIPMEFCHSFEQLSMALGAIFKVESNRAHIQRRYLQAGQYNLSIDHSTEVTQLTNDYWPTIEPGTTIVMSIVAKQRQKRKNAYQCQGCETWNAVSSADKTQTFLIDCGGCGRQLQVSTDSKRSKEKQSINITNKEFSHIDTSATDIQLIRNWRLETEARSEEFRSEEWLESLRSRFHLNEEEWLRELREESRCLEEDLWLDEELQRRAMCNNDDVPQYRGSYLSDYENVEDSNDNDDENDAYDLTAPITMLHNDANVDMFFVAPLSFQNV